MGVPIVHSNGTEWSLKELLTLQRLFIERYGPKVMPSQLNHLGEEPEEPEVRNEGYNSAGPRYF